MKAPQLPMVTKQTMEDHIAQITTKEDYKEWFTRTKARLEKEQPQLMEVLLAHAEAFGDAAARSAMAMLDMLELEYQKSYILPSKN